MQKQKVIAVDFDGTLCENAYPQIGKPLYYVIEFLKRQQVAGNILVLWSCREGKELDAAVGWCAQQGLYFAAINQNTPENTAEYQSNSRKVYADIYIDDKAMNIRDIP